MKIALNQADIISAIYQSLSKQGIELTGKNTVVEFTAKRKGAGISAVVDITSETVSQVELFPVISLASPIVMQQYVQELDTPPKCEPQPETVTLTEQELEPELVTAPNTKTASLFG